jgi:hypothetical protein
MRIASRIFTVLTAFKAAFWIAALEIPRLEILVPNATQKIMQSPLEL